MNKGPGPSLRGVTFCLESQTFQGPHPCADILGPWQDSAAGLLGFLYIRQMSCAQATTQSHGPH